MFLKKTESVEAVGDKSTTEKKAMQMILCFYSVSEGTAILLSQVNDATFCFGSTWKRNCRNSIEG